MTSLLRLEEAGLNAWPALRVAHVRGWVLRFAQGFTKRANSANPLYGDADDLAGRVAAVERLYADAGQPTIFRLTGLAPAALDALLDGRGYRRIDETLVETLDIGSARFAADAGFAALGTAAEWVDPASALQGEPAATRPTLRAMLERMVPRACFGLVRRDGVPVACGLAVAEGDLVGLFEIAVDPGRRRAGLGRAITRSLLAWGRAQGASTAYLQVTAANTPARTLYDAIGFRESHRYWYRVAPA
ncbi:MAG: GNAT family N-acetyltransferase [Alphaproteobacteria bacterium]|nr:GNAT family N-acetyltransferase [Alphaproteobacteria bacterium]